jgi:hypothetical protein
VVVSGGHAFVTGGYFFSIYQYLQGSVPPVDITLTPINPPITIPATGGTFSFNATVANTTTTPQSFQAWIMQQIPGGAWQGPMLGPISLTVPANITVTRLRSQNVPSTASPGVYTYIGYVGTYSSVKIDSSFLTYTKLAVGNGPAIGNWDNYGENFEPYLADITNTIPQEYSLKQNYPNPFNPTTAISYELQAAGNVSLKVYDASGRLVATLVEGFQKAGEHMAAFDGSGLASGIYLYRLKSGDFNAVHKMVLMK